MNCAHVLCQAPATQTPDDCWTRAPRVRAPPNALVEVPSDAREDHAPKTAKQSGPVHAPMPQPSAPGVKMCPHVGAVARSSIFEWVEGKCGRIPPTVAGQRS